MNRELGNWEHTAKKINSWAGSGIGILDHLSQAKII